MITYLQINLSFDILEQSDEIGRSVFIEISFAAYISPDHDQANSDRQKKI